jgi:hypothetical protein
MKAKQPHIVTQRSDMVMHTYATPTWERHIYLHNPLPRPVWLYIECSSHLTTSAIGVTGGRTSEIVLPDIPPEEDCLINHWLVQETGKSPPEWRP